MMNSGEEKSDSRVTDREETRKEARLIEQAQHGNQKAFGQLIRLHQKKLFRFMAALTGSYDMADDIVQESFVRAWKAIGTFKHGYAFYPWLSTIAKNLAFSELSRQEKQQSLQTMQASGFDPIENSLGPMEQLLDAESQRRFHQAVWSMPVAYRSVFVLRTFEEMDYSEIASYLKIPPGTVDSRLYRARKFLMEKLEDLL
ncbi:MAG: sigma-70 family RNA polymerase sigma factor [candidate division Zixibacteria bacterium]